jgi:prevent-host-death family protein
MRIVNIHEAKTQLSKLVRAVNEGEEIIIAVAGKPIARLTPLAKQPQRKPGFLKNKVKIAPDFNTPLPEDILASFRG